MHAPWMAAMTGFGQSATAVMLACSFLICRYMCSRRDAAEPHSAAARQTTAPLPSEGRRDPADDHRRSGQQAGEYLWCVHPKRHHESPSYRKRKTQKAR